MDKKVNAALSGATMLLALGAAVTLPLPATAAEMPAASAERAGLADARFKAIYQQEWKWRQKQKLEEGEDDDDTDDLHHVRQSERNHDDEALHEAEIARGAAHQLTRLRNVVIPDVQSLQVREETFAQRCLGRSTFAECDPTPESGEGSGDHPGTRNEKSPEEQGTVPFDSLVDTQAEEARNRDLRDAPDEANGHTEVDPAGGNATILYSDVPMIATLLFANTRAGRDINHDIQGVDVLESLAPPDGVTSFSDGSISGSVVTDAFGPFYRNLRNAGHASLAADGSMHIMVRGGMPVTLRPTDASGHPFMFPATGAPFTGEVVQRESVQFYPGEHNRQSIPRGFFNALCGGCHGSISDRELDVAADPDILTRASPRILARDETPTDLSH